MNQTPVPARTFIGIARDNIVDAMSAIVFLGALVQIGSLSGTAVVVGVVAVIAAMVIYAENAPRRRAGQPPSRELSPETKPPLDDEQRARIGQALMALSFFGVCFCEFFWYVGAYIPQPQLGDIIVTTPLSWCVANVAALVVGLSAYRNSPDFCRIFFTAGAVACVLGTLLCASSVPVTIAN